MINEAVSLEEYQDNTLFQTITFSLNKQLYAVNILYIKDIVMSKTIYRVPNSDEFMLGITNLRGDIIPVYSLSKMLHLPLPEYDNAIIPPNEDDYFIIFKIENKMFALVVDSIHKNLRATTDNYTDSNYLEKWDKNTIFIGVLIDEENNILTLDIPRLLTSILESNKVTKTKS